jgi:predicted  nucleic acid-binding Zn-ribbon protein
MAFSVHVVSLLLLACAAALEVTPIAKVISLLEAMKQEVEGDGKAEAATYEKFACFCKQTTEAKSDNVKKGNDDIDVLSADVGDKTQSKKKDSTELMQRKQKQEELSAKMQSTNARCAKDKAEYQAASADVDKAISSLSKAIKAMKDSKPAASLLQASAREDLLETLTMADALNWITAPKRKAVASMIQSVAAVDPSSPEYGYHSNDIIELCESLEVDFKAQKKDLDDEHAKNMKACDDLKASLKEDMTSNSESMAALEKNIDKLSKEIATARADLVEAQESMKDDELYLKDLTARCEARAQDFDQRSLMRQNEITAISSALKILTDDVKGAADDVNKRVLLVQKSHPSVNAKVLVGPATSATKASLKTVSLLQEIAQKKSVNSFLGRLQLSNEERKRKALVLLRDEGQRLGSVVLTSFASRSVADPFKKVKGLIQKLIERLLAESAAEATKKGFCDTELGKSRKERDFRFTETQDLSADLEALEAKEDALTQEIKELTERIKHHEISLKTSTEDRKEAKAENLETVKTAKDGLDAVNEALSILKSFYKQAAKASFVQASPIDEDTSGPGFVGAYKGKQSSSSAVLDLLQTIASDFDRTIRTTEAEEEAEQRKFVVFAQAVKASLSSEKTKKELDEQDLVTTKNSLNSKMEDLRTAQSLLDAALKEIESLKPTCIDTGMSYADRVAKREDEMAALKKALCILDEENVEAMCSE